MRWAICAWPGAAMSSRRSAPPAAHGSECRFLQSRGGLLALASTQAQAPPAARMVSQAWHADVGTLRTAHLVFARPLGRPLTAQGAWATCPPIRVPPGAPHGLPFRPTGGAPTASPCAPPAGPPRPPPVSAATSARPASCSGARAPPSGSTDRGYGTGQSLRRAGTTETGNGSVATRVSAPLARPRST